MIHIVHMHYMKHTLFVDHLKPTPDEPCLINVVMSRSKLSVTVALAEQITNQHQMHSSTRFTKTMILWNFMNYLAKLKKNEIYVFLFCIFFFVCVLVKKSDIPVTVSQLVPEYPSVHEHVYSFVYAPSLQVAGYLHGELLQASCKIE